MKGLKIVVLAKQVPDTRNGGESGRVTRHHLKMVHG